MQMIFEVLEKNMLVKTFDILFNEKLHIRFDLKIQIQITN